MCKRLIYHWGGPYLFQHDRSRPIRCPNPSRASKPFQTDFNLSKRFSPVSLNTHLVNCFTETSILSNFHKSFDLNGSNVLCRALDVPLTYKVASGVLEMVRECWVDKGRFTANSNFCETVKLVFSLFSFNDPWSAIRAVLDFILVIPWWYQSIVASAMVLWSIVSRLARKRKSLYSPLTAVCPFELTAPASSSIGLAGP